MNTSHSLEALLTNTATEEEIALLKRLLASGEISIGGNVSNSVVIQGSENNVQVFQLTPEMLELLGGRPLLGNLERDLNGDEIALGVGRLEAELPVRAPALTLQFEEQVWRLRPTLKSNPNSLSESLRKERLEALAHINSLCMEALDISFNAVATGEVLPEYEVRCPFRGLESFRLEDREFFFGREELTQKLVGKIQAYPFLAVLGASGSGKSSLVMAGMIPALNLDCAIIRPGTNPLAALESARGKPLLVADQFEELFTLTRDEKTRADFISALLDFAKQGRVIITLRSDFLGEVGAYRSLSEEIQNHLEIIPPMNADELRRAMEGQARWARLEFEADLSQQILDDVAGEPGAMPLLQHALWELWNRRHGRHLRANEYRTFGGVKQAITSTAEKVYGECSKPEQDQVRDIFLRLTRLDEGDEGRDTRRRVPLGDLIPSGADAASIAALLDKLATARLIVKTVNDEVTEIEVAHEALIRHWERLQTWLNEDRDNLRLRESVSESAKEWEKSGKHESLLNHRGGRLDDALLLEKISRLNDNEQTYLKACVVLSNNEQRERERMLRYTVFASVVAAIIFLVLGSFGLIKSNESNTNAQIAGNNAATAQANANVAATAQVNAEVQANIALARQLAAQGQSLNTKLSSKQMLSTLLSIQSMNLFPNEEAADFLINVNKAALPITRVMHDDGYVNSVSFSPDGKYVVSGGEDNTARVWEVTTGKEIARMIHDDIVNSVSFSPDGKYVVSGGLDSTVRVWEVATGKEIARMTHDLRVTSVAFSPDGKYLVSGGWDNTAHVWEVTTGKEVVLMTHNDQVNSVVFSPDGKYVVSGSVDGTARVWEVTTGKEIARMIHDDIVNSASFSPDGKYVVSSGDDNTARVWEVTTGKEIARMTHNSHVNPVSFSPDGKYVVSGSADGTARVWEVTTGKEISRMTHIKYVDAVAFSPDGKYVVSGSWDGTARVWDATTGKEIARMTQNSEVLSVAFSPDGKYVVSGGCNQVSSYGDCAQGTVEVWKVFTGKEIVRMMREYWVNSVAFSPDGKYVVSGSINNAVRVWKVATGEEIVRMTHDDQVNSVAFSSDGKYVVSGSVDGTARVWEVTTGKEIARMTHIKIVDSVAFSPDGKYVVSGSRDQTARVWETATGKEIARMTHTSNVFSVAFSLDGKYVVSGCKDGTVHVWEVATEKEIARMEHNILIVNSVAFSPDGKYVVSGGYDGIARIWEVATEEEIVQLQHEDTGFSKNFNMNGQVSSIAFSPDGKYVVSGSWDGTARVWDAITGKEIARMTHDTIVTSVAFSLDGKYVVSGSWDGTIRVWEWRPNDVIANACKVMPRNLTRVEWNQYIGDALPYQAVCPNLPIEPESTP